MYHRGVVSHGVGDIKGGDSMTVNICYMWRTQPGRGSSGWRVNKRGDTAVRYHSRQVPEGGGG